ncbi:MAG: transketolase [Patescibacteria group bacterium]|nr:MAG: transketolase [Patescibacteria group bacterium]
MLNKALNLNQDLFLEDTELKSGRDGFGDAILKLGGAHPEIVVLSADLEESVRVSDFKKNFPDRFVEVGIAEQNMASIAAGMALSGMIPFITSHAVFSPYGNWSQIRLSVCFSNANVKIVGSHSGFSNGPDGGSAESLEDVALARVLPNLVVLSPIDYWQTRRAIEAAVKINGPVYIRVCKEPTKQITTEKTPFEIGAGYVLAEGNDMTIFTTGVIAYEALEAAKVLKAAHKVDAEVISLPTIKPIDKKIIVDSAKKTGKCVSLEEHQINAGFGSAISEILAEEFPVINRRIGVNDTFGESGSYKELKDKYQISAHHVINTILRMLKEK